MGRPQPKERARQRHFRHARETVNTFLHIRRHCFPFRDGGMSYFCVCFFLCHYTFLCLHACPVIGFIITIKHTTVIIVISPLSHLSATHSLSSLIKMYYILTQHCDTLQCASPHFRLQPFVRNMSPPFRVTVAGIAFTLKTTALLTLCPVDALLCHCHYSMPVG